MQNLDNFFNQLGVPTSLKSTVVASLQDNDVNFETIKGLLFENQDAGTPRDGCNNDSFAVFGFLAFLLAGANLLLSGRRKRSVDPSNSTYPENVMMCNSQQSGAQWNQEGVLASYSLFRGFLNAMDAEDSICSQFFICEGSHEAAKLGWIGTSLAKVASTNAHSWLTGINYELHNGTENAGIAGSENKNCRNIFPCNKIPKSYRKPKSLG